MNKPVDVAVTLETSADRLPDLVFSADGDLLFDEADHSAPAEREPTDK